MEKDNNNKVENRGIEGNNISAKDFCGILPSDFPSAEEIRNVRTENSSPDLIP